MNLSGSFRYQLGHVVLVVCGLLLLAVAVHAASRGLNNYVVSVLEKRLGDWRASLNAALPGDRASLVADIEGFALPGVGGGGDAALASAQAELGLLRQQVRGRGGVPTTDDIAVVLDDFRKVVNLRPVWGRGWARFAQVKAFQDEFDKEFFFSLGFAMRMAPGEEEVQAMVVGTGFDVWQHLPSESRKLVWNSALTAMTNYRLKASVLRSAAAADLADHLVAYLDSQATTESSAPQAQKAGKSLNSAARYRR